MTTVPAPLPSGATTLYYDSLPPDAEMRRFDDPGPWNAEPDKIHWVDSDTDLDCLMVRNHLGVWCGYVGVGPTHALYEVDYDRVEGIDVHGGLTFSAKCQEEAEVLEHGKMGPGICHVPLPGRPAEVWWLGFDCGHAFDLIPGMAKYDREVLHYVEPVNGPFRNVYRDMGYVIEECRRLARQLASGPITVEP